MAVARHIVDSRFAEVVAQAEPGQHRAVGGSRAEVFSTGIEAFRFDLEVAQAGVTFGCPRNSRRCLDAH